MRNYLTLALLTLVLVGISGASNKVMAAADTCTWTGAVDVNWSVGGNWTGCDNGGVPEDGDSLAFPDAASNKTNANDLVSLNINTITITGTGYTITGNDIQISPTASTVMQLSGDTNDFGLNFTINGASSKGLSSSGDSNEISGDITLNLTGGADMNIGASSGNTLLLTGVMSGATDSFILSNSDGVVLYGGINTFTASGELQINNGSTVRCNNAACLGDSSNSLIMYGSAEVVLTGVMTFPYTITVNGGAGSPAIIEAQEDITLSGTLDINADTRLTEAGTGYKTIVSTAGTDIDAAAEYTVEGGGSYADTRFTIGGLTGAGNFVILASELDPGNNVTFDGDIYFGMNSFIHSPLDSHLGTSAGSTYFLDGAFLFHARGGLTTINENFIFEGTGNTSGPYVGVGVVGNYDETVVFGGTVTIAGDATFYNEGNGSIRLNGLLEGTSDVTLTGDLINGGYYIDGTSANTLSGKITAQGVFLNVSKTAGVGIAGNIDVVATATNDARLNIINSGGDQIANSSIVHLVNDSPNLAILTPEDGNEVVGMVTGDGVISQSFTADRLTIGGGNLSGAFTGSFSNIDGDGIITKIGTGTWTLDGAVAESATNPVAFDIQGGSISWSGSLEQFTVSVGSGGVFKGTGSAGAVTINSGGSINVGNSPGCMTLASLTLNNGSTFTEEIDGATACSGYDQTTVVGTADITNASLVIDTGYTPTDGTVFTILSAASVVGTFNGLVNGSTITVDGITFRVNYTATSVTLTKLAGTLTPTATPSSLASTGVQAGMFVAAGTLLGGIVLVLARASRKLETEAIETTTEQ